MLHSKPEASTIVHPTPQGTPAFGGVDRNIVVFDTATSGHHPVYIKHLVQYWQQAQISGTLHMVVAPHFADSHPDVVALASSQSCIQFTAIRIDEYERFQQRKGFLARSLAEWNLFCQYAQQLHATEGLLMHFDGLQIPLLIGKPSPCLVSGIYFSPTFHYGQFVTHPSTWKEKIRRWRQKALLAQVLGNSRFKTLFCLDPFAVQQIEPIKRNVTVLPLADPVQLHQPERGAASQLSLELGINPERQVFLLFGELSRRKGIYQVFEAVENLPSAVTQHLCLLLAGPIRASERPAINAKIEHLSQTTHVQVVVSDRYIKGETVQTYFEVADVVLALYQHHVGMSSILVHAAAAQTPVIATDYGLIGEMVRQYQLGRAVNSEDPMAIAQVLADAMRTDPHCWCDLDRMEQFVEQNLAEKFAQTIFAGLLLQPG